MSILALAGCAAAGFLSRQSRGFRFWRFVAGGARTRRSEAAVLGRLASLCRAEQAPKQQTRVARLVEFLARAAGFDPKTACTLATASTLHRIGHVSIAETCRDPDGASSVLLASKIATRLLAGDTRLHASAADMASTYRERWDGKGLPLGLSGARIPYAGRLLHVALMLDKMIGDQPLTPHALSLLVDRLEQQAGYALDPALAMLPAEDLPGLWQLVAHLPFAQPVPAHDRPAPTVGALSPCGLA